MIQGTFAMAENHANSPHPKADSIAVFAGGCFWCMEPPFDNTKGVYATIVGYTGGHTKNPTYETIGTGRTGHKEAVEIHFNSREVSYEKLLDIFWETIDPFDAGGQFVDRGSQYTTAVYFLDAVQKEQATKSKQSLEAKSGKNVATDILPAVVFYPAEEYHQDYYQKNRLRYQLYKTGSGR